MIRRFNRHEAAPQLLRGCTNETRPLIAAEAEAKRKIADFNYAKENLLMCAIETRSNQELLQTVPHGELGSLSLIYRVAAGPGMTAVVNNKILEMWGIAQEEIHEIAAKTAIERFPVELFDLGTVVPFARPEDAGKCFVARHSGGRALDAPNEGFGAGCLFYPGFLDEAAHKIKAEKYFIFPVSVHEIILYTNSENKDINMLLDLAACMASGISPDERLSSSVFLYGAKTKALREIERRDA